MNPSTAYKLALEIDRAVSERSATTRKIAGWIELAACLIDTHPAMAFSAIRALARAASVKGTARLANLTDAITALNPRNPS